jgi:hypothetical protein
MDWGCGGGAMGFDFNGRDNEKILLDMKVKCISARKRSN